MFNFKEFLIMEKWNQKLYSQGFDVKDRLEKLHPDNNYDSDLDNLMGILNREQLYKLEDTKLEEYINIIRQISLSANPKLKHFPFHVITSMSDLILYYLIHVEGGTSKYSINELIGDTNTYVGNENKIKLFKMDNYHTYQLMSKLFGIKRYNTISSKEFGKYAGVYLATDDGYGESPSYMLMVDSTGETKDIKIYDNKTEEHPEYSNAIIDDDEVGVTDQTVLDIINLGKKLTA